MARVLVLDSEALSALAHASRRSASAERARAVLSLAYESAALVRVPAPVLAELYRGGARDAAVDRILAGRGIGVVDLTAPLAREAGAILAKAKLGSAHAVDAFVVATAAAFGEAVIATHDPDDLGALAAPFPRLRIFAI